MEGSGVDTAAMAASEPSQGRALCRGVLLKAQLRERGSPKFHVKVLDLSTTGLEAEVVFTLHSGDMVWLTLPGLAALEATVAWRDAHRYGFAFRTPLYPAVFDHIIRLAANS